MKLIWSTLYDGVKDRRNGMFFLLTGPATLVALVLAFKLLNRLNAGTLLPYALVVGSAGLVWGIVRLCRAPSCRRVRRERQVLSLHERHVARSKLRPCESTFKSVKPVLRPPDTDLKM
jgi:hypothetical protein